MTFEEIQLVLSEKYCFVFDDPHPDRPHYRYGWADLDLGYRVQINARATGMLVEFDKLVDPDDFLQEMGFLAGTFETFSTDYIQANLKSWGYPPALIEHRRRILQLLAA